MQNKADYGFTQIPTPKQVKHGFFLPVFHLQTLCLWLQGSKQSLGPLRGRMTPKKILTECLLTPTAEFHTQLYSKAGRRKRWYFEFKMKFSYWTLLHNNISVGFHVCLNDFQIKQAQFAHQNMHFSSHCQLHKISLGSEIQAGFFLAYLLAVTRF